ncbi:hypothetical protein GOP47_0028904 [Adiantum capillus-veneris]|nr:hypothetical protein GOP47_0028904 [Adiantum capillus-veneris]
MVQLFGLLGVFKYSMDQAAINIVHQMLVVLNEVSKNKKGGLASLNDIECHKLIIDMGNKVWSRVVGRLDVAPVEWWATQAVPKGLIIIFKWASIPIVASYKWALGEDNAQASTT